VGGAVHAAANNISASAITTPRRLDKDIPNTLPHAIPPSVGDCNPDETAVTEKRATNS